MEDSGGDMERKYKKKKEDKKRCFSQGKQNLLMQLRCKTSSTKEYKNEANNNYCNVKLPYSLTEVKGVYCSGKKLTEL